MSAWHVDDTVAIAYGTRRLDAVQRASVEAHAVRCEDCRAVLAASATGDHGRTDLDLDLDQLWTRIEAAISAPELGRGGQALLRLGASMSDVVVTRFVAAGAGSGRSPRRLCSRSLRWRRCSVRSIRPTPPS